MNMVMAEETCSKEYFMWSAEDGTCTCIAAGVDCTNDANLADESDVTLYSIVLSVAVSENAPTASPTEATEAPTASPTEETEMPTTVPTHAPTAVLSEPVPTVTTLRTGASMPIVDPGRSYSVGDHIRIGDASPAWAAPAMVEVTGVDENGGITTTSVVDGGSFIGDDILGQYDLTPFETSLLLMASNSEFTDVNAVGRGSKDSAAAGPLSTIGECAAIAAVVIVVAALAVANMRQRFSSSGETTNSVVQTGHASTAPWTPAAQAADGLYSDL
jgi:hypothetical protein